MTGRVCFRRLLCGEQPYHFKETIIKRPPSLNWVRTIAIEVAEVDRVLHKVMTVGTMLLNLFHGTYLFRSIVDDIPNSVRIRLGSFPFTTFDAKRT